jgi:hypothetical protein
LIETDQPVLYEENCGGRIGTRYYAHPHIKLKVYEEFLMIGCRDPFSLNFSEIKEIKIGEYLGKKGVLINHSNLGAPDFILLYSKNQDKILQMLGKKVK